ncbi:MAG TPA: tRNA (adenosine(37)-N6)-threonylcarbamoyltransferase complex dimerization subunit type 1 TsaB [Myxococcota bacterium]|nr:tRNA (adenosine(37)-N6)-threonylcarbamoyltransferase complex dimerization subunit type 1 TsaB [Myxococcota bacterium]
MAEEPHLILAVESATSVVSVALLRGEVLVDEWTSEDARAPSERLLPGIDALLARTGTPLGAIAAFAVSVGPGSFTGLRVGIATVKGLAFASGRRVAAVPTLAALAHAGADGRAPVAALLDARRGEVYAAVYGADGAMLLAETVAKPAALAERLAAGTRIVAGEGAEAAAAELAALRGADVVVLRRPIGLARARAVGVLGARLLARGAGIDAPQVAPRYVRRAEAEARRTGVPLESERGRG